MTVALTNTDAATIKKRFIGTFPGRGRSRTISRATREAMKGRKKTRRGVSLVASSRISSNWLTKTQFEPADDVNRAARDQPKQMLFNPACHATLNLFQRRLSTFTRPGSNHITIQQRVQGDAKGIKRRKEERGRNGETRRRWQGGRTKTAYKRASRKRERETDDVRQQGRGWCGVKAASPACKVRV